MRCVVAIDGLTMVNDVGYYSSKVRIGFLNLSVAQHEVFLEFVEPTSEQSLALCRGQSGVVDPRYDKISLLVYWKLPHSGRNSLRHHRVGTNGRPL